MQLFGTDGVRGRANCFPMTVETALLLGKAMAVHLRRTKVGRSKVVIGKDTRLSCYMFENALIAGLCSMGVDTLMVGPLPTPGVAFITRAYRADAGIVISASHNAYYDNGIKIFNSEGYKISDAIEDELTRLAMQNDFTAQLPLDAEVGKNKRIADADGRYIEFVKATFTKGLTLNGLKIFLDCAHGAAHRVAPLAFAELDAQLVVVGAEPNGLNINENCGSLHPTLMQEGVRAHGCNVGIALDGDADRVIMADERGNLVDGDTLLAMAAIEMKREGRLLNNRVVATVMTNGGVLEHLAQAGIEVLSSKVGDRYVIAEMIKGAAYVGGEQSGHLIFLHHNTTGDGIVSALQVLRIMCERGRALSALAAQIPYYPQALVNVSVATKPPLASLAKVQKEIAKAQKALKSRGRVLVRYSGTEELCRVMVEGREKKETDHYAYTIANAVKEEIGL